MLSPVFAGAGAGHCAGFGPLKTFSFTASSTIYSTETGSLVIALRDVFTLVILGVRTTGRVNLSSRNIVSNRQNNLSEGGGGRKLPQYHRRKTQNRRSFY